MSAEGPCFILSIFCLLPWRTQWTASFFFRTLPPCFPWRSTKPLWSHYLPKAPDWRLGFGRWIWGENKRSIEHSTTIKIKNTPRLRALKQQSLISPSFCGLVSGAGPSRKVLLQAMHLDEPSAVTEHLAADRGWRRWWATCLWCLANYNRLLHGGQIPKSGEDPAPVFQYFSSLSLCEISLMSPWLNPEPRAAKTDPPLDGRRPTFFFFFF